MCDESDFTPPEFSNLCRHCRERPAKPDKRGLCRCCYDDVEIREEYEPKRNTGNRLPFKDCNGEAARALSPTYADPGSPERVALLRERAALKMELFLNADYGWATASYAKGYREDGDE